MTLTSNPGVAHRTPRPTALRPAGPAAGSTTGAPRTPSSGRDGGRPVARRNLIWSIFAEHLGFSVWLIWSVSSAFLVATGFDFTAAAAVPAGRAAEPGRLAAAAALHVRGAEVRRPQLDDGQRRAAADPDAAVRVRRAATRSTPYWVFCLIAATAGLGGGNFASSMANINFFYPAAKKGAALGLNAAGGNLGVALIQLFLPVIVGGAGIFGLVKASDGGLHLRAGRAGCTPGWPSLATARGVLLHGQPRHRPVDAARAARRWSASAQTWIMSFLYIGTFGSFIGYSAAMPLLIKLNFWVPEPAPLGTGIYFAYFAFLGALVGSLDPAVRRLAGRQVRRRQGDPGRVRRRWSSARSRVLWTLIAAAPPNPTADPAIATRQPVLVPVVPRASSCACSPRPASATARRTG